MNGPRDEMRRRLHEKRQAVYILLAAGAVGVVLGHLLLLAGVVIWSLVRFFWEVL